jgi:type VI secretion system secreted protein Hcp
MRCLAASGRRELAEMADLFLDLTGVTGESLDAKHAGKIEFHQLKLGLDNKASPHMSEGEATKHASADHMVIGKWVDNATPTLARFCAHGKHIDKGTVICRKNDGDKKVEYLTIELEHVKIDRVDWGGRGEETNGIQETVELSFQKFTIKYILQLDEGGEASGANEFPFSIPDQKSQSGKPGK